MTHDSFATGEINQIALKSNQAACRNDCLHRNSRRMMIHANNLALPSGELCRVRLRGGDDDRRRLVGQRVDAGLLDRVVLAAVGLVATPPELADRVDRLLEHLEPLVRRRPLRARHVLVEVLAGADAEEEPPAQHHLRRRRRLGDDRRVDPDQRARDRRPEADPLGRRGDAADHAPDERALALLVDPRVEVVGDEDVLEARLLGAPRVRDEVVRRMLLRGEPVADFHLCGVPSGRPRKLRW